MSLTKAWLGGALFLAVGFAAHPAAAAPNAPPAPLAINSEASAPDAMLARKPVVKAASKTDASAQRPALPAPKQSAAPVNLGAPIERVQATTLPPVASRPTKDVGPEERPARVTPIAIRASEPNAAPSVRPADVQAFQKIGAPYQVNGTWYIPSHEPDYNEVGTASWYGRDFHGKSTANGEVFDMNIVSAAHPTLPIPSLVEVTNLSNGRSMVVRVNDRGPFVADRLIDLSARGAELLGYREQGSTQVRVRYIGPADPEPLVTQASLSPAGEEKKWVKPTPTPVAAIPIAPIPSARVPEQGGQRPAKPTRVSSDEVAAGLYVQAGAFSRRENAERALAQMSEMGPAKIVETETADGRSLYRILIGPVKTQAEATALAESIASVGVQGAHVMASR